MFENLPVVFLMLVIYRVFVYSHILTGTIVQEHNLVG